MSEDLLVDGYDYNPHTCMVEVPYNDYWDMKDRIINLKKENEYLQNQLQQKDKEIERLNNIINELEKELKEDYKIWMCNSRSNGKSVKFGIDVCKTHFYNRLQELKGSNSNENL